jgi:hypothetical protein
MTCSGKAGIASQSSLRTTVHKSTPVSVSGCPKAKKAASRAQKLTAALKVCKKKAKAKRASCQAQAQKQYGTLKKHVTRKK